MQPNRYCQCLLTRYGHMFVPLRYSLKPQCRAFRTSLKVRIWPIECNTGVVAHVCHQRNYPSQCIKFPFHLIIKSMSVHQDTVIWWTNKHHHMMPGGHWQYSRIFQGICRSSLMWGKAVGGDCNCSWTLSRIGSFLRFVLQDLWWIQWKCEVTQAKALCHLGSSCITHLAHHQAAPWAPHHHPIDCLHNH